jgi:hypothetical protein
MIFGGMVYDLEIELRRGRVPDTSVVVVEIPSVYRGAERRGERKLREGQ